MTGDPRFHELLKQIGELHDKKQLDYGAETDPFANVRASEEWGVAPWVGALVRLNDKVHRLQQFAKKGELANESAEDSMMDIAVYALIALVLYREETAIPRAVEAALELEDSELQPILARALARVRESLGGPLDERMAALKNLDEVSGSQVGGPTDQAEHEPDPTSKAARANALLRHLRGV
jgi:hypothetical protein